MCYADWPQSYKKLPQNGSGRVYATHLKKFWYPFIIWVAAVRYEFIKLVWICCVIKQ